MLFVYMYNSSMPDVVIWMVSVQSTLCDYCIDSLLFITAPEQHARCGDLDDQWGQEASLLQNPRQRSPVVPARRLHRPAVWSPPDPPAQGNCQS